MLHLLPINWEHFTLIPEGNFSYAPLHFYIIPNILIHYSPTTSILALYYLEITIVNFLYFIHILVKVFVLDVEALLWGCVAEPWQLLIFIHYCSIYWNINYNY